MFNHFHFSLMFNDCLNYTPAARAGTVVFPAAAAAAAAAALLMTA